MPGQGGMGPAGDYTPTIFGPVGKPQATKPPINWNEVAQWAEGDPKQARARLSQLWGKMDPNERKAYFAARTQLKAGAERHRPDNSVLGAPPEIAAAGVAAGGIGPLIGKLRSLFSGGGALAEGGAAAAETAEAAPMALRTGTGTSASAPDLMAPKMSTTPQMSPRTTSTYPRQLPTPTEPPVNITNARNGLDVGEQVGRGVQSGPMAPRMPSNVSHADTAGGLKELMTGGGAKILQLLTALAAPLAGSPSKAGRRSLGGLD